MSRKTPSQVAATWEPIDSLTPWEKNPRHNAHAVDQVARSMERFGFSSPIIARTSDRVVIAGHTRLLAAQKLGMDKVPVRFMDLDPDQAAALALADNKLGEVADWDDQALAGILRELEENALDLDGLGWSGDDLEELIMSTPGGQATEGWQEFDGAVSDDAPSGKVVKCPHCNREFEA